MNTAELKVALMRMLLEADDATTKRFYDLLMQVQDSKTSFSQEEVNRFEDIKKRFLSSEEKGTPVFEAHSSIRKGRL